MARPRITGISRPSCPRGHVGDVYLDGSSKSRDRSLERPRFRCLPTEHGERQHVFLEPLSKRRQPGKRMECDACERLFLRAEGLAGGWHFTFVIREIATTLVRVGRGNAYRRISEDLRKAIGRVSARGAHIGEVATTGQLAMDYTDVFAPIVLAPIAVREWPAIVAVDSIPLRISDHSTCCRQEKEEPLPAALLPARFEWLIDDLGDRVLAPTTTSAAPKPYKAPKPKLTHSSTIREVGQVLVAVGQAQLGEKPKVLLARFVAAGDELSWTEFFLSLPGTPRWIVSDRAIAIINAVRNVWHSQVPHYYCEAHIAKNVESVAPEDGCLDGDPIFELIERAQWSEQNWRMLFAAASLVDLPKTTAWMRRNLRLDASQRAKRELPGRSSYPRSAGACEDAIRRIRVAINDRMPHFRNANRLNLFLALAVAEINGQASVAAYSRTLRAPLAKPDGRVSPVWGLIRDPRPDYGPNSIETLAQEAEQRAADHKKGLAVWWLCENGSDHEWTAQVRNRTISGARCPFCTGRRVAPSDALPATHPAVAAQWHPTKNGTQTAAEVSYGSDHYAWWQCDRYRTHVWRARINSRTGIIASGCRHCAELRGKGGRPPSPIRVPVAA